MPSRIIREGILTSERVEQLAPPDEVFYRRLLSKVDDHGLYDARPSILRTSLYPLRVDRVREADISRWMAACQKAGLIALYVSDGKPYLQVLDTRWTARSEPKYPLPPSDSICDGVKAPENNCAQPLTAVPVVVDVVSFVDVVDKSPRKRGKSPKVPMPENFGISARVRQWAGDKGHARLEERLEHFKGKALANGYTYADWDEAFMGAIRDDWAKLPAASSSAVPRGKPKPAETPLERQVAWLRQQRAYGAIDEAEFNQQVTVATEKHRATTQGAAP